MVTGKAMAKQILFIILVLIAIVPFYMTLRLEGFSHFTCIGLGVGFFIVGSGLGLLYGWLRWRLKGKDPSEKDKLVLSNALQYCFWLIPASVAFGILVNIMGLNLGSIGLGAVVGFVSFFIVQLLKLAPKMGVQVMGSARESRSTDYSEYEELDYDNNYDTDTDYDDDYDDDEIISEERPLGSVEEALKPKFSWGKECSICGKQHGITPGFANKWHECTQCGEIYCDNCGRGLDKRGGFLDAQRCCSSCGGETRLI